MTPVLLVGMPGSGKTTLGLELARRGYRVCDLDRVIEHDIGKKIFEIIRVEGIEKFRDIEYRSLAKTITSGFDYIAAGGGLMTHSLSLRLACDYSTILCLVCTPNEIARRCYDSERDSWNAKIEGKELGMACESDTYVPVRPLLVPDGVFTYESIRRSLMPLYYERMSSFAQADLFVASQFVDVQALANLVLEACSRGKELGEIAKSSCPVAIGSLKSSLELTENEGKRVRESFMINTVTEALLYDGDLYKILCETAKGRNKNWILLFSTIYDLLKVEEIIGNDLIDSTSGGKGSSGKQAVAFGSMESMVNGDVDLFYKRLLEVNPHLKETDRAYQLRWFVGVCAHAGYCGDELFRELSDLIEGITGSVGVTDDNKQQADKIAGAGSHTNLIKELVKFHIEQPGVLVRDF